MKYMGSKRAMLGNGLGAAVTRGARRADRIVDLFSGSGAVATYAAEATDLPVRAVDLQQYAVPLAASVITRTAPADAEEISSAWLDRACNELSADPSWEEYSHLIRGQFTAAAVWRARVLAESAPEGSMLRAFGGHYYAPSQALTFDYLLRRMPKEPPLAALCSAAMIRAGSRCAAAPGHTAQPFQPTQRALPFIRAAWMKDPITAVRTALADLAPRYARTAGNAERADALDVAATLGPGDLAIVDPPYSAVQYSRFYHVLEALAKGYVGPVTGAGRYAPISERPKSDFSMKSRAPTACTRLLEALADAGCRVIFTFPIAECSNGLSGHDVLDRATGRFKVEATAVNGRFSTLGGNARDNGRAARHNSQELILTMVPRIARIPHS